MSNYRLGIIEERVQLGYRCAAVLQRSLDEHFDVMATMAATLFTLLSSRANKLEDIKKTHCYKMVYDFTDGHHCKYKEAVLLNNGDTRMTHLGY